MPEIVADCLIRPATSCFSEEESNNINHLVLISFRLARAGRRVPSPAPAKTLGFCA
jgi:hypothetical protein